MAKKSTRARKAAPARRATRKSPGKAVKKTTVKSARARRNLPPGICRVEQASTRTFGYVVRVGHRPSPKGWRPRFTAYFGDFSNGGKKNALEAATRWLDRLQRTGKPPKKK